MFIRYVQDSGEISGIFPSDYWENHVPEGHAYIERAVEDETGERLMAEPGLFAVRDDGSGPELYEREDDATAEA